MAQLRRFGQLATLSHSSLGQAIELFRRSPVNQRLQMKADYSSYVARLLDHKHSSKALSELLSFAIKQKIPVTVLGQKDEDSLKLFMLQALRAGNIKDVNSALYLYHCHPITPIPSLEVYMQLVTHMPTGSAENQKLWKRTMCEMLYYSYPACMNKGLNQAFFSLYGPISESLVSFMRLAAEDDLFDSSEVTEDDKLQSMESEKVSAENKTKSKEQAGQQAAEEDNALASTVSAAEEDHVEEGLSRYEEGSDSDFSDKEEENKGGKAEHGAGDYDYEKSDEDEDKKFEEYKKESDLADEKDLMTPGETAEEELKHQLKIETKTKRSQDDFITEYLNTMNAAAYEPEDYALARDYFIFEATSNLRLFPRDAVSAILSVAREQKDWEFVCRLYMHYEDFSAGRRPDILVSCALQCLLHAQFSGNHWGAVKQIVSQHISRPLSEDEYSEAAMVSEPALCQFDSTNSAMISGLISGGLHERAALYMFDCRRCGLDYDPRYELVLAEHFKKKKDLRNLMIVRDSSDDMINSRRLVEWTEELRGELQQKGEVHEDRYLEEKYYKYTDGLLRPYLKGLGIPVAPNEDEDYKYAPDVSDMLTELVRYKVDLEETDCDPKIEGDEDEEDEEGGEKNNPAGIDTDIIDQAGENPDIEDDPKET